MLIIFLENRGKKRIHGQNNQHFFFHKQCQNAATIVTRELVGSSLTPSLAVSMSSH